MKIPGAPIIHAVITPNCRTVERPELHEDPRMAAFEEAVNRAREKYRAHIEACDPELLEQQNLRLVVLAETPGRFDSDGETTMADELPAWVPAAADRLGGWIAEPPFRRILFWIEDVRSWAFSGPWWLVMLKTALTHGAIWVGLVVVGAVLGRGSEFVLGLHPFWSFAFPLAGFSVGHDFYWQREYGPDGDSRKGGWRAKLDAALDYFLPRILAGLALYGVVVVWAWGALRF